MTARLSGRVASSATWLVASRIGTRAIDFVSLLVLARLLTPADFGIVAIGMTLVQLVEAALELPVGQVLVRSSALTQPLLSTAFTLSLLRGAALALVLVSLSLPFAALYRDDRLVGLICFLSLAPAFRGLVSPNMIVFARAIDFRREIALDVFSKLVAFGISGAIAFYTASYWAIAAGAVCSPLVLTAGSYAVAPFRPKLSLEEWPTFASFLGWTTAAQIIVAINWQADRPILGLFVPPASLGAFSIANDLSMLPEQALIKPIQRPLLSGFAAIQDDMHRLRQAYLKTNNLILTLGAPVMVGVAFLGPSAMRLAFGAKWDAAAPIVQWLALTLIIPLLSAPMPSLAMALGKTYVFFRQSVIEILLRLPVTMALTWSYGIPGLIAARFFTAILNTSTSVYYVKKMVGLKISQQLLSHVRPLVSAAVMAIFIIASHAAFMGFDGAALAIALASTGCLAMLVYLATNMILWRVAGRPPGMEAVVASWVARHLDIIAGKARNT